MTPRVFTLPEQFIKDESVPCKWKVLSILNGFWIAGKTFYGTNEWLVKNLCYSERHIQRALEELEKDGLITRNIAGFRRLILPGGCHPTSGGGDMGRHQEHDAGRHHISDSNTDNILGAVEPREEWVDEPLKPKKDTEYLQVFALFGKYPLNWKANKTMINAAKNVLAEHGIEEATLAYKYYLRHKNEDFIPEILSPVDLDRKWQKLDIYSEKHNG